MKLQLSFLSGLNHDMQSERTTDVFVLLVNGAPEFELTFDYGHHSLDWKSTNAGGMGCKKLSPREAYLLPGISNGIDLLIRVMGKLDALLAKNENATFYSDLFYAADGKRQLIDVDFLTP